VWQHGQAVIDASLAKGVIMVNAAPLILFDCDGTLTDSHGLIVRAMQLAFCDCELEPPTPRAVQEVTGLSLSLAVAGLTHADSMHERIATAYRSHYRAGEADIKLFPGVRETLDALKSRGYWLGIVTGKSKPGLMQALDLFSLHDYFYVLRTADCTHSKPHPAMVLECMAELGAQACDTHVIGDAVFDMQMACAAGVRAIGVSYGAASAEMLREAGASHIVDHFPELLSCFPEPVSLLSSPL